MPLKLPTQLSRSRSSSAKSQPKEDYPVVSQADDTTTFVGKANTTNQCQLDTPKSKSTENLGTTVIRLHTPQGFSTLTNPYSNMTGKDAPKLGPFQPMSYEELYVNPSKAASANTQVLPISPAQQQTLPGNKQICQDDPWLQALFPFSCKLICQSGCK